MPSFPHIVFGTDWRLVEKNFAISHPLRGTEAAVGFFWGRETTWLLHPPKFPRLFFSWSLLTSFLSTFWWLISESVDISAQKNNIIFDLITWIKLNLGFNQGQYEE